MDEEDLIRLARKGNMSAFQQLLEQYYPVVERFAYQLGNHKNDIPDITQEVFIRVYRFLDQFSQAKFSTWLYKITLNVTRDMARKRSQHLKKVLKIKQEHIEQVPEVESYILQSEEDRNLHKCLQTLDEKYRIPIILYYFHDKKYEEISEIMSSTLSTVKTRILRGKALLKKALEELEEREGEIHG
ncbi:RNA polymerase sigma factor [Ferdinandcohnia quinoae]|uniref:RNA polymerase sigma factor n=1 Tax=Fredinandcohnia quinoae TaxID=2918902 RepID=A0AAW5E2J2_9BACI|nr:RNA polymerase sigma factor [Fredinandcohnia sp. SECRCQ15]MCH1625490.1 RNA polymerase sigma factor [Fredinandcohnia sp. SECRCQ15]